MKEIGVWAHYDKFGLQYVICQICGQHCPDIRPLARHVLYNTSPSQIEHHQFIEKLTGRQVTQFRSKGGLSSLANALTKELRRVKMNSRKKAVYLAKKSSLEQKCVICGSTEELELDHIDGNSLNNKISNLRWLCIPCHHSSHDIFGSRNQYKRCSFCKKLRICNPYNKFLLCGGCSLRLWYRWKERTKINFQILSDKNNPEFKKWVNTLTF